MKKIFFILFTIISFSSFADTPEKIEKLTSKVIMQNSEGYFVLSDGSSWKVIGFSKRWRSLSEWWNNIQLTPESYNCLPGDWELGSQIEVFSKSNTLSPVDEANASNQEALKECTYLLINSATKQILFGIPLEPEACITRLAKESHEEGYNLGYKLGYNKATTDCSSKYNEGYSDGYTKGKNEGYAKGNSDGFSTGYKEGLTKGNNEGYAKGKSDGFSTGNKEGYTKGNNEGYAKGKSEGYKAGYEASKKELTNSSSSTISSNNP
jgi:flagellar biosynthesis/type III secretory pathway protein FliH